MLSTATTAEVPDERHILTSRLTTPTAHIFIYYNCCDVLQDFINLINVDVDLLPLVTFGQSNSKQTRTFLDKLELAHNEQMDSSGGIRVQNSFPQTPASVVDSSDSCPGKTVDGANERGKSLISKAAISVLNPYPQQFILTLFLEEKGQGTGEFRPVINLKALNRFFFPKEKFKIDGLHTARSLLCKGDYIYDETRPQERLLCSPDTPGVEETSSFAVQGNN